MYRRSSESQHGWESRLHLRCAPSQSPDVIIHGRCRSSVSAQRRHLERKESLCFWHAVANSHRRQQYRLHKEKPHSSLTVHPDATRINGSRPIVELVHRHEPLPHAPTLLCGFGRIHIEKVNLGGLASRHVPGQRLINSQTPEKAQ